MTWVESVPTGLACVAWLFLPGLALAYAFGLRGVALWASAPVGSVTVLAATAIVAHLVGLAWSPALAGVVCLILAVLANLAALAIRLRWAVMPRADRWPVTVAALGGLLPGAAFAVVILVRALGRPGQLSQTFDAAFHYNALALILQTHNGSSLGLATLDATGARGAFYPAGFHDVASLALMSTGASIPVGANLLAAAIAVLAWPLACVLLARQLFGPSPAMLLITAVLSTGFIAFPWSLMSFGVVWANLLGMIFVPVGLAAVLSIVGLAEEDVLGRFRAWILLGAAVVGGGLAHPNAVFSLFVLAVVPAFAALIRRARTLGAAGRRWRGIAELAAAVFACLAFWAFAATSSALAAVRAQHWPPFETPARAVGEVLLNATNGRPAWWLLSALVVLGAVATLRARRHRWLIVGHALSATLYVLTAAVNTVHTQKYTGYWYNDSFRLAAMVTITAVPLAVLGLRFLAERIEEAIGSLRVPDRFRPITQAAGIALVLTLLLVLATGGLGLQTRTEVMLEAYGPRHGDPGSVLVTTDEQRFFPRLRKQIPEQAVVANNPWDGSVLLWTLAGRRVLVPHLNLTQTDDERYVTEHLVDVAQDPRVCEAAVRLKVEYMVIGDGQFWAWKNFAKQYAGITDPGTRPGFQLVDVEGANRLYRITACTAS